MFKKKPQIKNLSPLRSSDRRRLADQIISDYSINIPTPQTQPADTPSAEGESQPQVTLSSIRTALLPESTSSARFTTTAGVNATLVSGTVYVGAHPGQDERILWIQYGKDPKLIPTVYTLWHNPDIVPLIHTQDFVVDQKLRGGADLMVPGLVKARSRSWDARAKKGSIVAVAGISSDTVPLWVGASEIDISALSDDTRGQKGVAVKGLHWEGDELWNWSAVGKGGQPPPTRIEGWHGLIGDLDQSVGQLDLEEDEEDEIDGGASLAKSTGDVQNGHAGEPDAELEDEKEPTTKEVDDAFYQAFLYSLYNAKKNSQPPNYGFDLPIQPSFLISNMIQPHLRIQNQHYTIKKTSWKNTKKFIKHLDKTVLVKSKDRNGGETVILDIDFNDEQVKNFTPYKLPKPKPAASTDSGEPNGGNAGDHDTSLNQKLTIQNLYRASSKLVPDLLPSKTQFYTAQQITTAIKTYAEANPQLTQGTSSARYIKLDPFIAHNILGSNSSQSDGKIMAAGEIARDVLARRIIEDDHLAVPYYVILRNDQTFDPENPSPDLKPKSGQPPKVQIIIEKRTGTKVVTKISNLEPFNINPQLLAPELQRKCAGSASVGQHVGGKPGMMEIVVQGDQRDILTRDILSKRGVDTRWVVVDDKTKKKAKK